MECKRSKTIILPTEDKTNIAIMRSGNKLVYIKEPLDLNNGFQHLYFTTDDKIKEGDWYIYKDEESVFHTRKIDLEYEKNFAIRKIVATTDPKLTIKEATGQTCPLGLTDSDRFIPNLPEPSQAFVEKYCELGGIDEVLIEYERLHRDKMTILSGNPYYEPQYKIKVDSRNTITIHPIKNSWGKEEVRRITIAYEF